MQKSFIFLLISIFSLLAVSCKNETKKEEVVKTPNVEVSEKPPVKRAPKKELTPEDVGMVNSVMARIMATPETKKYASYLVTAEMVTTLSEDKGPFTVFAPTTNALESLTAEKKKFYAIAENRPKLVEMLQSFIVKGKMDKETLIQTINKNGKAKLKTLAGVTLTATKVDENIVISDGKGAKVTVTKGSIDASNGVVYVVDGLLNAN